MHADAMQSNDAEVLLVGDELLKGLRRDAHLIFIGRQLAACGVRIGRAHTTGDVVDDIAAVVAERAGRTRILVVSGGLGPTDDDVTRQGVAQGLGLDLQFHEPSWTAIQAFFEKRGRTVTESNRQQAMFPAGASVIENDYGTAPGFRVDAKGTTVFVLPGPPRELNPMLDRFVVPAVTEMFQREPLRIETFRTLGVGETHLVATLQADLDAVMEYTVSYLPSYTGVDIVFTEKPEANRSALSSEADAFADKLSHTVGSKFYERGQRELAEVVGEALKAHNATVGVAESLTGGWIGKRLTDYDGSSKFLLADIVAYSNESKTAFLGVQAETLEQFGAVSEEVCTEMAHGIRHRAGAAYGVATTGIAGPTGGTMQKPVGLTYLGVSWDGGCQVKRMMYRGSRRDIREMATQGALWLLHDALSR